MRLVTSSSSKLWIKFSFIHRTWCSLASMQPSALTPTWLLSQGFLPSPHLYPGSYSFAHPLPWKLEESSDTAWDTEQYVCSLSVCPDERRDPQRLDPPRAILPPIPSQASGLTSHWNQAWGGCCPQRVKVYCVRLSWCCTVSQRQKK